MSVPTEPDIDHSVNPEDELQGQMSFFDHLEELRNRIIRVVIIVGAAFGVCWYFVADLFKLMQRPLEKIHIDLVILKPTDNFNVPFKVAIVSAIFLASPLVMREIWMFISPALYKRERRYAMPFIIFSGLLFIMGGAFGYFVAFPLAMQFLINFGEQFGFVENISAMEYFDLFLMFEVVLGVVFEIPAVIFILARIGLVTGPFLLRNFRYAILIACIAAAILTPTTDIPNMMMVGIPMIVLYGVGIIIAYIFGKKREPAES